MPEREKARPFYEAEATERRKRKPKNSDRALMPEQKGRARDYAGKAFGVSGKYVDATDKARPFYDAEAKERMLSTLKTGANRKPPANAR
ncbi:MAG: hypothetical protein ACYC0L_05595 [Thermoleophilia bacterium]